LDETVNRFAWQIVIERRPGDRNLFPSKHFLFLAKPFLRLNIYLVLLGSVLSWKETRGRCGKLS
jgi:hypothetical protein